MGRSGSEKLAPRNLTELESLNVKKHVPAYDMAIACLGPGEKERSLKWLWKSLEDRSGWLAYLAVGPRLDPLRPEPEFARLMKQVSGANSG